MTHDPLIIGLCGTAGAGKDTAADYLFEKHGFHCFAFADPLREMLFSLLEACDIDHVWITERHLKEQPIPGLDVSYRQMAQTLGTEWARQLLGADFWLRTASLALGFAGPHGFAPIHDRIVITDVRFPNEAAWITQHHGRIARITRPSAAVRPHLSETLVDQIDAWACIDNSGTVDQLHQQLDAMVAALIR